jgi:hypothetical protein
LLDRPGNDEIQLDVFLSYGSNPPLYPAWQSYFGMHQPPMLIAWGTHDQMFPAVGAESYKGDLKTLEYHLLDAGHFALETNVDFGAAQPMFRCIARSQRLVNASMSARPMAAAWLSAGSKRKSGKANNTAGALRPGSRLSG